MNASATEKTSSYELTWSLQPAAPAEGKSEPALELTYAVTAAEEMYIADRLWDYAADRRRVPDPQGVYRFVRSGSLRLVFEMAPHAPNVMVGLPYRPLYSRILAGETRRRTVRIATPVTEYSAMERNIEAPSTPEGVSRVILVMGYCLRSKLDSAPKPPPRESPEEAGYVLYEPALMISELAVEPITVLRRTGYMARYPLPGEPGPEPISKDQLTV